MTAAVLYGQQTPRLHLVPPSVSNAAQDCIDIYELAGQRLDPWQGLSLVTGLGEREDGNWAAFEVGIIAQRQNGKGAPVEALLLASAFIWGNPVSIYSAHRGKTVDAIRRRVRALIENTDDLARRCQPINDSDDVFVLTNSCRIEFHTRTKAGGRGLTGELVVLDEALELTADQLEALVPTMLARPGAQLWYTSTVPKFADQHLCTVRARVLAGAPRLAWAEWGVDRGANPTDPQVLVEANPGLGYRITLERLLDLRGILGPDGHDRECLGIWPEMVEGAVLDPAAWRAMLDPASRRAIDADLVLHLDVTPMLTAASITMYALRSDGLEHMQLVSYDAGVAWLVSRAAVWREAADPALWVVHRKNGAYAMREQLAAVGIVECEDRDKPRRGELLVLDDQQMADAVSQFIEAFRRQPPTFRHLGQEPADRAVTNATVRPIGDSGQIAWARRKSEEDIGPVVGFTAARYAHAWWLAHKPIDYDLAESVDESRPCGRCGRYVYRIGDGWRHAGDDSQVCDGG